MLTKTMQVSIPVLVTEHKQSERRAPRVFVRPLFALAPVEQEGSLRRALGKLGQTLREQFEEYAAQPGHYDLAWHAFAPYLATQTLRFRLFLGNQSYDCKYLFVTFDGFGKRLVYTPNVERFWFEIERGEDLQQRAEESLTAHFRALERRDGRGAHDPAALSFPGKAFVTTLDVDFTAPPIFVKPEASLFADLAAPAPPDGAAELRRVGRCLDALYPDDLERAVGRATESAELARLLDAPDRRPVVILGRRQTGKTNLLHEYVFERAKNRRNANGERLVWLISPARLISGMSLVGQWENRLTAILKEARTRRHLLYFDDLPGLFFAGVSAGSDLNVAQVLKPYVERRDVRVVAEATPETWRVLQEKDRSFTELFRVFRLSETTDDETLKILLDVRRDLEHRLDLEFALDALPTALDLQRRYQREAAFPGKAASFLKQLANKFRGRRIERADVLREFEAKSGMQVAFLDDRATLDRDEIVRALGAGVIGQTAAVEAAADVVSVAKARLNDPHRPLASFLFLGATGVGKTEAARRLAAYLYGRDETLLRFDMNEFVAGSDVARLVGTFNAPEGLLTSAIRRRPFSVVLLDEIEKAHPDVFNLLLQVLGDGRLTDALGRTADFSNAIVIMTSNLGAREAGLRLGFRETNESNASIYRQAAEKFFRPEFFNRLDRIVAFENLSRADVGRIARLQLQKVFAREGFVRRRCRLEIAPDALERIVDEGYHPELGARALKRAIEKNLTRPVAARLAALETTAPATVRIALDDADFVVQVEEIAPANVAAAVWQTHDFADVHAELDRVEEFLDRIERRLDALRPAGEIVPGDAAQARYFLALEYVRRIERMIERADRWSEQKARAPRRKTGADTRRLAAPDAAALDVSALFGAPNLAATVKSLAQENRAFGETAADYVQDIWREAALLEAVVRHPEKPDTACALLAARCAHVEFGRAVIPDLLENYRRLFGGELGLQVGDEPFAERLENDSVTFFLPVLGAFAFELAAVEAGRHLFVSKTGEFSTVEIFAFDLPEKPAAPPDPAAAPDAFAAPVVRLYTDRRAALDFRTALVTREALTFRELRTFLLGGLAAPPEIER